MRSEQIDLPSFVDERELLATIRRLDRDPEIHGIIVQLPVPKHISELAMLMTIDPAKDVDGLHPLNVGLMVRGDPSFPPATPYGIVELLLRSGVELEGAEVVVVGYGDLVGAPLSIMLAQDSIRGNATVTICHIKTRDLASHTRRADILVAAAGTPQLITADMVKPGAVVIDVGVHRTETGLIGDVRFDEVKEVAGAITPVPGGVGPMTTAMLLLNTVAAAEALADRR
jgi:methylenetetrahydrofolate dehydrogenase (NADP+)/methenyltetrahydrofolate cyclohydrolase